MLLKRRVTMSLHHISWILYIVGSLLVFGSWMKMVPTGLAWCGWLMALAGWAIGSIPQRQNRARERAVIATSKADEIAKLVALREQGVLTEMEFQREKQRILREP